MDDNKHLFILCPPASGSTLLWKIIQTSPKVSAFSREGKGLVKHILAGRDRWDPSKRIPWERVKRVWYEEWDLKKPILLEKSPPHLVRASQLEQSFPHSYFIISVRNPYAFCEGLSRRHPENRGSYYNIAKFWIMCCKYQIRNIKELRNKVFFSYEDVTNNPSHTSEKIIEFLPDLDRISVEEQFAVFEKSMKIENLNKKQISRLSDGDIYEINQVLEEHSEIMSFFHYKYLEPSEKISLESLKKISIKLRAMKKRPRAVRWADILP